MSLMDMLGVGWCGIYENCYEKIFNDLWRYIIMNVYIRLIIIICICCVFMVLVVIVIFMILLLQENMIVLFNIMIDYLIFVEVIDIIGS